MHLVLRSLTGSSSGSSTASIQERVVEGWWTKGGTMTQI